MCSTLHAVPESMNAHTSLYHGAAIGVQLAWIMAEVRTMRAEIADLALSPTDAARFRIALGELERKAVALYAQSMRPSPGH